MMPRATVSLLQPGRIDFGPGCLGACAEFVLQHNPRSVAIVANSRTLNKCSALVDELRRSSVDLRLISNTPAEPTVADFEKAQASLRDAPLDAVIGIGGGSVLDVAKLLAGLHGQPRSVREFFGQGLLPRRTVLLVCVPTTAGSGSEVSPNSILLDEALCAKKAVISPWLVPDAAFIDPALTVSVPPDVTAATGIDALVHCLEAFANKRAHPAVDTIAIEGIRLIGQHLERAVLNGDDLDARTAVARGSLYGGLCLGPVNTAAIHALAYPLGSLFAVPHGLANALMMAPVLRFNLPAAPHRYAEVARALGIADQPGGITATAEAGVRALERLAARCGIPRGLESRGISRSDIQRLVQSGMQVTRLLQNNVREICADDAAEIYSNAF
jgi:alcohol dehydrogenase